MGIHAVGTMFESFGQVAVTPTVGVAQGIELSPSPGALPGANTPYTYTEGVGFFFLFMIPVFATIVSAIVFVVGVSLRKQRLANSSARVLAGTLMLAMLEFMYVALAE